MERICEETVRSFYGCSRKNVTSSVLCESAELFENGAILSEDNESIKTIDYTKKYTPAAKRLDEMYIPEKGDEVISMNETETLIKSGNVQKKVLTEDYLVKDIRAKISEILLKEETEAKEDKKDIIKEEYSDDELREILKESQLDDSDENLSIVKEELGKEDSELEIVEEVLTEGKVRRVLRHIGRGVRTALMTVGGAAIGTLVGGAGGAAAGAAAGAGIGAGAGAATGVASHVAGTIADGDDDDEE